MAVDLRRLVRTERTRRGLSIRDAATLGKISNTTWGGYEAGGNLTPRVRTAVALAFGWMPDWPENPPAPSLPQETVSQLGEIESLQRAQAVALAEVLDLLRDVVESLNALRAASGPGRSSGGPQP